MAYKFYYFDSYRVRLAYAGGAQGLSGVVDSGWIVANYSGGAISAPYMTIDEGVDTVYRFHGLGYSAPLDFSMTALPDYIDFVLALNANYHCTYDDLPDGTFETGSIDFADTNIQFADSSFTSFSASVQGDPSLYQSSQFSRASVSGNHSSSTQDVQYLKLSNAPVTVGGSTIGTCPKFTAYQRDTFTAKWLDPSADNRASLSLNAAIPASSVTVTTRHIPPSDTTVKKIWFRDASNALVFYEYMGASYTQALRHGEGMLWHGLGDGHVTKALIHEHFAWVYIYGQKYLCKSLGQDLSVY